MSFHIVIPVSNTQSITRLQQKFQDAISCMTDAARLRAQGQWYLFKQRDGKSRLCSNQLQVQLFTDQAKKSLTLSTSPILTMDPQDWSSDVISHLHETIQSGAPGYRIWRPPGWSVSRHVELRNHTDSAQPCMPGVGVSAEQKKLGNERLQVEDVKVMETYGNIWKPSNIGNIQVLNQGSSPHRRCLARCTCVSVCVCWWKQITMGISSPKMQLMLQAQHETQQTTEDSSPCIQRSTLRVSLFKVVVGTFGRQLWMNSACNGEGLVLATLTH